MGNLNISAAQVKPLASSPQPLTLPNKTSSAPEHRATSALSNTDRLAQNSSTRTPPEQGVRFFFMSDNHSRPELLQQLIAIANTEAPDFVLDGGDTVNDGTESELNRARELRSQFEAPVYQVTGNHDAHLRGPFKTPPPSIPDFQSFSLKGAHFILLDNEDETLTEAQFQKLEADLKAHQGQPIFVAMHVPPKLSKTPLSVKLAKVLPVDLASPVMRENDQVERLHRLMKDYQVKAVLAGHTHYADELVEDGVRYVTVGSSGGLSPKPGVPKEFLDIRVNNGDADIQRVTLAPGKGVVHFVGEAFDFYRDLNQFNHSQQGWEGFEPTANVGYTTGLRHVTTDRGTSVAVTAGAQIERPMGPKHTLFGGMGISAGGGKQADYGLHSEVGYRYAVAGDYAKGVYVAGSGVANAGYLHGKMSAGVGAKAAVGVQYKNWRIEVGQEINTNSRATTLSAGFRF